MSRFGVEDMPELEKEREERKEAELSVAAFERQLASIKEQCALLDIEIEQRRAVVLNLRRGTRLSLPICCSLIRLQRGNASDLC